MAIYVIRLVGLFIPEGTSKIDAIFNCCRLFGLQLLSFFSELVTCTTFDLAILHDDPLCVTPRLVLAYSELFSYSASLLVPSVKRPVVEDDRSGDRYVQTGGLVRVLRDIHKVVTHRDLVSVQTTAFVTKHETGVSSEWHLLDGP